MSFSDIFFVHLFIIDQNNTYKNTFPCGEKLIFPVKTWLFRSHSFSRTASYSCNRYSVPACYRIEKIYRGITNDYFSWCFLLKQDLKFLLIQMFSAVAVTNNCWIQTLYGTKFCFSSVSNPWLKHDLQAFL